MIRKFYLENEYGQRWDLNDPASGLLVEPEGLGYGMDTSYTMIGHTWIRNYMREKQQAISGKLIFGTKKPYIACNRFIQFVNMARSLKFVYKSDAGEYLRHIDQTELKKTEIGKSGAMECPVKFVCRSLFFLNQTDRFVMKRSEGELRWNYRWPARINDYSNRKIDINNDGHVPAAFELEISGYCENPAIEVFANKESVGKVVVPVVLQQDEKMLYSSVDGNLMCMKVDAVGNEINLADVLDINNANFFKLPVGDSEVRFSSDTGASNRTTLIIYKFFRAV